MHAVIPAKPNAGTNSKPAGSRYQRRISGRQVNISIALSTALLISPMRRDTCFYFGECHSILAQTLGSGYGSGHSTVQKAAFRSLGSTQTKRLYRAETRQHQA
jgi:hypothetical protein